MAAYLEGELEHWPSKARMAELMRRAGFDVYVGTYSVRLRDCSHFVFQEYGGDLGDPQIDADATTLEQMCNDARRVSEALAAADVRHRFEVHVEGQQAMAMYFHYRWPNEATR